MTSARDLAPSGSFVVRTPLLPASVLEALVAGTAATAADADLDAAVVADLAALQERMRDLLADPAVREAVYVASPSLYEEVSRWLRGEKVDDDLLRPLLSYVTRMCLRPTPFGLFAGCSAGTVGDTLDLTLPPRAAYRRATRLDYGFLAGIVADVEAGAATRPALTLVPNSSLYRAGGRLRMAERRIDKGRVRYHRVAFEEDEALAAVLEMAAGGTTIGELVAALTDEEITAEEAAEYVDLLVDSQLLVSDLGPPITGGDATTDLAERLCGDPETAGVGAALDAARRALADLDARGVGNEPAAYAAIADGLRPVDEDLDVARLFQVDMAKPATGLTLSKPIVAEVRRAIELLHRLTQPLGEDELSRFRSAFTSRYEDREVPLVEALDEELGIGFGSGGGAAVEGAPLLAELPPVGDAGREGLPWRGHHLHLLRLLLDARASGATELRLTPKDLDDLANAEPPDLPDALVANVTLIAPSVAAVQDGQYRLLVQNAFGPSGAQLLGRFCHVDPGIEAAVRAHITAEERHRPDAVFAEIVHLPEGRIGNILARPVLRDHEIVFLGKSGAPAEGQVTPDDLLVSVRGNRIVLRSARLGREVLPRLTSAHNVRRSALAVYRFLAALQNDNRAGGLMWNWAMFDGLPFLPRVVSGRLVLHRARWLVGAEELKPLFGASSAAARYRAVQSLRAKRELPRHVVIAEADNELPVDLDTVAGTELFAHEARRSRRLRLLERFPGPDELPVTGPEGAFTAEFVLPLVAPAPSRETPAVHGDRPVRRDEVPDTFPPGSAWLMAKLYTGRATADMLLREFAAPLLAEVAAGGCDGWFFIRYGDPEWHVRLRLHGEPARVAGELLPLLHRHVEPFLANGTVWRVQLDTYRREVDRYGGPEGIVLAERLFQADSEAALAALRVLDGEEALADRWRLALVAADRLLADFGFDVPTRRAVVRQWRDGLTNENGALGTAARQLAGRLMRRERATLDELLTGSTSSRALTAGLALLDRRSAMAGPIAAELRELAAAGRLTQPLETLVISYNHMTANRLLRGAHRLQELVIHDLLDRLYSAQIGRTAPRS